MAHRRNTHLCTWVLERSGFEPVHTYMTVHTGLEQANRSEMVDNLGLLIQLPLSIKLKTIKMLCMSSKGIVSRVWIGPCIVLMDRPWQAHV
jgi:hypothetical protein